MKRLLQLAFAGWLAFSMSLAQAWALPGDGGSYAPTAGGTPDTSRYTADSSRSDALTSYLKKHRLPLVGAQVLNDPSSGGHVVVLYGFVATDFGKNDAASKARAFLKDPSLVVENRVMVEPEIASRPATSRHPGYAPSEGSSAVPESSSPPASASANADNGSGSMAGPESYLEHQSPQSQIQQYQNQQNPLANSGMAGGGMLGTMGGGNMVPLIALLGLLAGGSGGSTLSFGSSGPFGMPNSFGGGGPYQRNPYSGGSSYGYPPGSYPSGPYGSPYGSPYSGPPGSFSPYP